VGDQNGNHLSTSVDEGRGGNLKKAYGIDLAGFTTGKTVVAFARRSSEEVHVTIFRN
jgi:hypothetical protein